MYSSFKNMTNDELEHYINDYLDEETTELAFLEYTSRLDWNKVPPGLTPEEEKHIIEELIAKKTEK